MSDEPVKDEPVAEEPGIENGPEVSVESEVNLSSEEDIEKHLKATIPKIQKLSEDEFRAGMVTDFVGLQVLMVVNTRMLQIANKNFLYIQKWMKEQENRTKAMEEKLEFLETAAKNDDPKKKTEHYLS